MAILLGSTATLAHQLPAGADGSTTGSAQGFRIIIFDHSGFGLSTGEKSHDPIWLAYDINDLIDALGLKDVVNGGRSCGAIVAQTYFAMRAGHAAHFDYPELAAAHIAAFLKDTKKARCAPS